MPRRTEAIAPTIWATIRPPKEIQAERTFALFFFALRSSSVGAGAASVIEQAALQ